MLRNLALAFTAAATLLGAGIASSAPASAQYYAPYGHSPHYGRRSPPPVVVVPQHRPYGYGRRDYQGRRWGGRPHYVPRYGYDPRYAAPGWERPRRGW